MTSGDGLGYTISLLNAIILTTIQARFLQDVHLTGIFTSVVDSRTIRGQRDEVIAATTDAIAFDRLAGLLNATANFVAVAVDNADRADRGVLRMVTFGGDSLVVHPAVKYVSVIVTARRSTRVCEAVKCARKIPAPRTTLPSQLTAFAMRAFLKCHMVPSGRLPLFGGSANCAPRLAIRVDPFGALAYRRLCDLWRMLRKCDRRRYTFLSLPPLAEKCSLRPGTCPCVLVLCHYHWMRLPQ